MEKRTMKNPEEKEYENEDSSSLKKSKSISTRSEEQEKSSNQASSLSTKTSTNPSIIALEEKSKKKEDKTISVDDNLCGCCGEEECEENVFCSICVNNLCGNCLEEDRMCECCYENDKYYCKDCAKQNCLKKNGRWTCEVHEKHCRGASYYRFDDDVDEEDGPILGPIFAEMRRDGVNYGW